MAENNNLTPKQYKFLASLLSAKSVTDAAKDTGINEATAYRWINDPTFKQVREASQSDLFEQGMSALKSKFVNAVQTLDSNLAAMQSADQIRAAKIIIEQTIANEHLVDRIAELEAQVAQQEQERLYHVSFDLRLLTRAERDQIEAMEARLESERTKE